MENTILFNIAIASILISGALLLCQLHTPFDGITIGIIQTASHPALDAARNGFEAEMIKQLGAHVRFVTKNAQGSIANAQIIAQSFANNIHIDGILAIATPAAQALAHIEHIKPVFIAAVTDPVASGLLGGTNNNVCGSSDMVNSTTIAQLAITLAPTAHTAALLFTVSEASSAAMAQELQREFIKHGLQVFSVGIAQEIDLPAAVHKACTADIIITPIDHTVASAIAFIATQTQRAKKPLIVSDNFLVNHGALAAAGVDYTIVGKQAAECAIQVLVHHKKPITLPLMKQSGTVVINKKVLIELGLCLPPQLSTATFVQKGNSSCC